MTVAVVGAGPAGLSTAIAATLRGLEVKVYERRKPPLDKACGEGLMPDASRVLESLGVEIPRTEQRGFVGIRYFDGEVMAEGRFDRDSGGLGVRRLALHRALVDRARQLNIEIEWGARVGAITYHGLQVDEREQRCRWVVVADGARSALRRSLGLEGRPVGWHRFGVRRHYSIEPWSEFVEVYWGPECEAYVTPVSERELGVAMLWSGRKTNFDQLLSHFPSLQARLKGAPRTSKDRGAGPFWQPTKGAVSGRAVLVGDAGGYIDPITGEGLAIALREAEACATALSKGRLEEFERQRRRIRRFPELMLRSILLAERRPWLRRRFVRALAADPVLFDGLLAVHGGHRNWLTALPVVGPRLAWGICAAAT